jgi:ABC-type nitrate/sulfonate/bicarbonate transport system substrate-binding protein
MAGKKKIRVYYRAAGHVPLWKVMEHGGFLEKHGVEIELGSREGLREQALQELRAGELDIISGNHHNLYAPRALKGEPFVHIAQTNNQWKENFLVLRPGLKGLQDLKGKRLAMDDFHSHNGLNVWRYLQLNGLEGGKDIELVDGERKGVDRIKKVMSGEYDATFVRPVEQLRGRALGANIIEMPSMPMIEGVTLTTTTTYVNSHEEEIHGLLLALIDATHFFKTRKQDTLNILKKTCGDILKHQSDEESDLFYKTQENSLEPKPYPSLGAIENVFALAVRECPEIRNSNPLAMWDLHHVRAIDDTGYIDKLWANN